MNLKDNISEHFSDHFSGHSAAYRQYRPVYPSKLYRFILRHVERRQNAWDAGTGNGQVAAALSRHFHRVYASDASGAQIENAVRRGNIEYFVAPSESTPLPSGSIDLVTVAQALHWFSHDAFYAEVERVSRAGAVIAAWGYGLLSVSEEADPVIRRFNGEIIARHWPEERRYVEERYETIPFPFERIEVPHLHMEKKWTLDALLGYISTWSAVQRYVKSMGVDPVAPLGRELSCVWGEPSKTRRIRWPLFVLVGKVNSAL